MTRGRAATGADGESSHHRECGAYKCDIRDAARGSAVVQQVLHDFGQIDILVNNAGVNIRGLIHQLSLDDFQQVQDTSVTGHG